MLLPYERERFRRPCATERPLVVPLPRALAAIAPIVADRPKVTNPSINASMRVQELRRTVRGMPMSHVKSMCRISWGTPARSAPACALSRRAIAACIPLATLAGSLFVEAADLSVMVVGRDGRGVDEVVVTAMPAAATTGSSFTLKP